MSKIRKISETSLPIEFNFSEYDFKRYWNSFLDSSLGSIYGSIPWEGLVKELKISDKRKGRKSVFSPQGKLALMFLKSYTSLSDKKLIEQLNANYEFQYFCDIEILPENKISNYKIVSEIRVELSKKLDIFGSQKIFAQAWKPYMNYTDGMLEDATCYETSMRYPTDVKLLWEATEWVYGQMKKINKYIKGRMPRSKFNEQRSKYLSYSKRKKKSHKLIQRRIKSLLYLLEKLLNQLFEMVKSIPAQLQMSYKYYSRINIIKKVLEQQSELFLGNKIKDRIVSIAKSYIRPIVRGKEGKRVEFGAKANIVQIDKIDFIEHISFNAFNEGTRLVSSVLFSQSLFDSKIKYLGADAIYATNTNRKFCSKNDIISGFIKKGRKGKDEPNLKEIRRSINIKRATEMEGAFGKHKNHYNLRSVNARTSKTELLWIFFGIHTGNAVEIGKRIKQAKQILKRA